TPHSPSKVSSNVLKYSFHNFLSIKEIRPFNKIRQSRFLLYYAILKNTMKIPLRQDIIKKQPFDTSKVNFSACRQVQNLDGFGLKHPQGFHLYPSKTS
ncbi:MAG: hypothetical protein PHG19_02880, partial [Anaerotignum sp.]|nr:hypothetical protein [Anaerotignum sp.]